MRESILFSLYDYLDNNFNSANVPNCKAISARVL